jgi:hypothetical protein
MLSGYGDEIAIAARSGRSVGQCISTTSLNPQSSPDTFSGVFPKILSNVVTGIPALADHGIWSRERLCRYACIIGVLKNLTSLHNKRWSY